jgi:CubicO group peptidase (beta-lactamase class C family)
MPIRIVIFALAMATSVFAQSTTPNQTVVKRLDGSTIRTARIDETVTRLISAAQVIGVGIAILNNGAPSYLKTYGFRDRQKNLPLTENTVMGGASLSKAAFAYLAMQLVDQGKLNLDKPVYLYLPKPLPELPAYRDLAGDQRFQQITARMLLSHTSGFPNIRQLNDDLKLNINFQPGSRYAYSGEGIQLLQLIVETITNKPLKDLMQEHVFAPFGMTRTSMISEPRFDTDIANGYDEWGRSLGPQLRQSASAAGSMQTTLGDFTRFLRAVIQGTRLRRTTRNLMLSPQVEINSLHQFPTLTTTTTDQNESIRLSYGLGWGLFRTPYGRAFFKEGHDSGFRHYAVCFDTPKTCLVIMTNSSNGEGIFKELLDTLVKDTFTPIEWEQYTPYEQLPPRPVLASHTERVLDRQVLEIYVGHYELSGTVLTVRRKEGHLSVQEGDQPAGDAFPESDRQFFSKNSDDVFSFEVNDQGRATALTLRTGGRVFVIPRID